MGDSLSHLDNLLVHIIKRVSMGGGGGESL